MSSRMERFTNLKSCTSKKKTVDLGFLTSLKDINVLQGKVCKISEMF